MKITLKQLKQLIKEAVEQSMVDEQAADRLAAAKAAQAAKLRAGTAQVAGDLDAKAKAANVIAAFNKLGVANLDKAALEVVQSELQKMIAAKA